MSHEIRCPSGLIFQARPIRGEEIVTIAERAGANASGEVLAAVMGGCHEPIIDPGPYAFVKEGPAKPEWLKLAWGDLLVAVIRLRIFSFPRIKGTFDFDFSCEYGDCKKLSPWTVDLQEMLDGPLYRELSAESRAVVSSQGTFSKTLFDGTVVRYDISRGVQDKPMKDLMKREKRSRETDIERVAKQLLSVDGLVTAKQQEPVRDLRGLWNWVKGRDIGDIDDMLEAFRASDCGLDVEIRATCTHCKREQDLDLPLGRTFFRPRTATKKASTEPVDSSEASSS